MKPKLLNGDFGGGGYERNERSETSRYPVIRMRKGVNCMGFDSICQNQIDAT